MLHTLGLSLFVPFSWWKYSVVNRTCQRVIGRTSEAQDLWGDGYKCCLTPGSLKEVRRAKTGYTIKLVC